MNYDLTFYEALDVVLSNEAWVQGEDFSDGVVLMMSGKDDFNISSVVVKNFGIKNLDVRNVSITSGLVNQKYRKVYTERDAMRN